MNKKLLFLIVALFILMPFVFAEPPFINQASAQSSSGFQVENVPFNTIEQGKEFSFEFHVFNLTNGVPINFGISCDFHLYNQTSGTQQYGAMQDTASNVDGSIYDYEFVVDGGNFSEVGEYAYLVSCNNSKAGGFFGHNFLVTPSGEFEEDSQLDFIAIILYILGMMFLFGVLANFLKEEHPILSLIFLLGILILMLIGSGSILEIARFNIVGQFETDAALKNIISILYYWTITMVIMILMYVFLMLLDKSLQWGQDKKEGQL